MRTVYVGLIVLVLVARLASHCEASLVVNGDFSLGDTGFVSEYATYPFAIGITEATYQILANPSVGGNGVAASYGDHTTGNGLMMAVNGSPIADKIVWGQTISVTPNTTYDFAAWISSWYVANPALLNFSINGSDIGTLAASSNTGQWDLFYATWSSGLSTTANIAIVNANTQVQGNDFALDDIYFGNPIYSQPVVPEPAAFAIWGLGGLGIVVGRIGLKRWHGAAR